MTHSGDDVQKIAELNSLFIGLNDKGKDSALTILRALSFAQTVMRSESDKASQQPPANCPDRLTANSSF